MAPLVLPPPFAWALAVRVTVVWIGIHFAAGALFPMMGRPPYEALLLGTYPLAWVWSFVLAAVVIDMRTRNEHLILANLGVSTRLIVTLVVGQCVVMDGIGHLVTVGALGALRPGS